jgi:uncharacterized membrane protein YidH (DUF202 family)
MEPREAIVSGLIAFGLLIIAVATVSWTFSILDRLRMPVEAYAIVVGVVIIVFALVGARMLSNE